jgi:hypothetical protein
MIRLLDWVAKPYRAYMHHLEQQAREIVSRENASVREAICAREARKQSLCLTCG